MTKCKECEKEFEKKDPRQKFCSHSCAKRNGNRRWYEKSKEKIRVENPKFCEICKKELSNRKYKVCRGECRKQLTFLNRKILRDNNQRILSDYKLSKGCSICGYNKCPNALEFHHKYGKDFKMNAEMFTYKSKKAQEKIKKELEKCILVCSNCHREIHYKGKEND